MSRFFLLSLFIGACASVTNAQLLDKRGEVVHPYYIIFDTPVPTTVEDIRGEYLHISYLDRIGRSETLGLSIYNEKRELVKEMRLIKQFGENYFDIQLEQHGITLEEKASYICMLKNENDEVRERTVRYVSKLKNDVTASIVVSPKFLTCGDEKGSNLVEFFGQVGGGKAPYKANWYVLNARRTNFLYQPAYVEVPMDGLVSSVQVDKSPVYFVLLHVTDACGNEQVATVQIVCDKNEKKVNTLFFQKLDDAFLKKVETYK
jgi:hypothetical protein